MKSNRVKENYSKYKKVSTNIKGDLLLDDSFLSNNSKENSVSTETVSFSFILKAMQTLLVFLVFFFSYFITLHQCILSMFYELKRGQAIDAYQSI